MLAELWFCLATWFRFRTYRPLRPTPGSVFRWLKQFSSAERAALRKATPHLIYISEAEFVRDLVDRTRALMNKLALAGVSFSKVVYVSIGDAGSSSHAVLNMVRDRAQLQNLGCRFVDCRSRDALRDITTQLGSGVIVYVDDFSGTGDQFIGEQEQVASYIVGNFAQYYLLHTACEEAMLLIDANGVVPWQHRIHQKVNRPLHENSTILSVQERKCLIDLCQKMSKKGWLGYGEVAASVVFYHNAPDNIPRVFRGDKHQRKYRGLVPRTTDLPKQKFAV